MLRAMLDDDQIPDPPPEELEMGIEDATGRPIAGPPAERIAALQRRIKYLESQPGGGSAEVAAATAADLRAAREQLRHWQVQEDGKN
jgi:hypothetical protein